jgi:hypothetical protein
MSSESPKEEAAASASRQQSDLSAKLASMAYPQMQSILGAITSQLGNGGMPTGISDVFNKARNEANQSYDTSIKSNEGLIRQQALQSGGVYSTGQISDTQGKMALQMNQARDTAMNNLKFQEAQAGMGQYNQLMNMLGGGGNAAMNMGNQFTGLQMGAIGGMNNQSPLNATMGGAMAGAGAGSAFGPWGALAGGVIGGGAGYLGSGG